MAIFIDLWHRLIQWICLSLFLKTSLPKRPHLESGNEAHVSGKKSAVGSVSTSFAELRRKGEHGGQHS